jgi:hypothetical protein
MAHIESEIAKQTPGLQPKAFGYPECTAGDRHPSDYHPSYFRLDVSIPKHLLPPIDPSEGISFEKELTPLKHGVSEINLSLKANPSK